MSENSALIPADLFNVAKLETAKLPETFDAALALFEEAGMPIDSAAEVLADEFPEVSKEKLVNVPFLAMTWTVSKEAGKGNNQFITVRGITKDGRRFRFADGSTGIFAQLAKLTEGRVRAGHASPNAGLYCPAGLRYSEYDYTNPNTGEVGKARTYYLNNEAD